MNKFEIDKKQVRRPSSWWKKLFTMPRKNYLCADVEALAIATNSVEMVGSQVARLELFSLAMLIQPQSATFSHHAA